MERTTLEVIAATVDEAVAQGLIQLNLTKDEVDVEVLDAGGKGFLGIGGRQARVRLTVKQAESTPASKSAPTQTPRDSAPVAADEDRLLAFARQTVTELITKMKVDAKVTARYDESESEKGPAIRIDIRGDDLSVLIGRRAETLSALQYIAALIVSKEAGHWVQLVVDVEGYRNRRERQLRQLARRMADQAMKTGKRQVLEPMSAAERRVIHIELRSYEGVTTESVGEEPGRKITIIPK
jgi:spoIIIJ-associated protein